MIHVVRGEPLPMEVRPSVGRHHLGTAGHVLRAVGLALMVGAMFVVFATVATAAMVVVSPLVVVASAGTSLAGLVLIHQGSSLIDRVTSSGLHPSSAEPVS